MKKALIIFNVILGGIIFLIFASILSAAPEKSSVEKKRVAVSAKKSSKKSSESASQKAAPLLPPDKAAEKVTITDVFNNVRSPLANVRSGRNDMALVGVFKMGEIEGAIIKQNTRNRQFNPFLLQAMRMSGFGGGNRRGNFNRNQTTTIKQYVRLGETMSNGYVLTEVSRTRAVLERGSDKIELDLQDPSKNRAAAASSSRRMNSNQQFQQAQMFMQSQMLRTMMQIQRNNSVPANRGNSGGNRGRR